MKPGYFDYRDLADACEIRRAFELVLLEGRRVFLYDDYHDFEVEELARNLRYLLRIAESK